MQKAKFPMTYLNVTQGYGMSTPNHQYKYPLDLGGKDTGIDNVFAPFDCVVKNIYNLGHTVWVQSVGKVEFANGVKDYATVSFTHDNNISKLKVGQKIKQGKIFYQEGKNNAAANHIHLECARGKYVSPGWQKFVYKGVAKWRIINAIKPESLLFITDKTKVINAKYKWKKEDKMDYKKKYEAEKKAHEKTKKRLKDVEAWWRSRKKQVAERDKIINAVRKAVK